MWGAGGSYIDLGPCACGDERGKHASGTCGNFFYPERVELVWRPVPGKPKAKKVTRKDVSVPAARKAS